MEPFLDEFNEKEIRARDSLQFELKSEFFIHPHLKKNIYKQEIYLFIPRDLHITQENYSKEQFYLDQTNLIRYKTPVMTIADIANLEYLPSPLSRLNRLLNKPEVSGFFGSVSDELKLFAAIFRSAIRDRVYKLIGPSQDKEILSQEIDDFLSEVSTTVDEFRKLRTRSLLHTDYPQLISYFKYVDEFISTAIDEFLVMLLLHYRTLKERNQSQEDMLAELIIKEKMYRKNEHFLPDPSKGNVFVNESTLFRYRILQGFVLEALMLKNVRSSPQEKHRDILGSVAAAFAMLFYMSLLVWKGSGFVVNSFPFVALAVFLYVIKDRMKEGFKILYSKQAPRWFPDFSTEIRNSKGFQVGRLTENFAFIDAKNLPPGFHKIRNQYFHEELRALDRHEIIMQYKREVTLYLPKNHHAERRRELTTIFRLNIHHLLQKANNANQVKAVLDLYSQEISEKVFPKVYHLSLILRNSFLQDDLTPVEEIKTYRVVVDKNGIKRVEEVLPHDH